MQLSDVDSALESDAVWLLASFQGAEGNECSAKAIELAQAAHALGSLAKVRMPGSRAPMCVMGMLISVSSPAVLGER